MTNIILLIDEDVVFEGSAKQAIIGLKLLKAQTGDGWYVNNTLSQADIMAVVCYQAAAGFILPDHVDTQKCSGLAALSDRATKIHGLPPTAPRPCTNPPRVAPVARR